MLRTAMMRLISFIVVLVVIAPVTNALICGKRGQPHKPYNPKTHGCKGGLIYVKQKASSSTTQLPSMIRTTSAIPTKTTTTTTTTTPTIPVVNEPACLDPARVTMCTGQKLCDGYQCCGTSQTYHPHFSTCCQYMRGKIRIHHNKPERNHVCCKLDVYKRGKQSCLHSASNDALWSPSPYRYMRQSKTCFKFGYVVLSLHRPKGTNPDKFAVIELKKVYPRPGNNQGILTKDITFDTFSPRRKLRPGKTLLLTNHVRDISTGDFYVFSSDEVYSLPKKLQNKINLGKKISKKISKRLSKNCKKMNRKPKHTKT